MAKEVVLSINQLSLWDRLKIVLALLKAPLNIVSALIFKPFTAHGRSRTISRVISDRLVLTVAGNLDRKQMRAFFGTTWGSYEAFVKKAKLPEAVEELGEDARLLWIGPKRTDKVILYLHGGAYLFAAGAPDYWRFIQEQLEERGQSVGCVMLNYTFVPDQTFPVQLKQGVLAIQRLIQDGVEPKNLILVGDSAGGAFIHQLLSHILHPVDNIPALTLSSSLGGAYLMSPWSTMVAKDNSLSKLDYQGDILMSRVLNEWGSIVLKDLPPHAIPYLEANSAPKGWYTGVDKHVSRLLVSAGGSECLRDEIIKHYEVLKDYHPDVSIYVQDYGVHNDPYWDIGAGDKRVRDLTAKILDWLYEGFSTSP